MHGRLTDRRVERPQGVNARGNNLIAAFPDAQFAQLRNFFEPISLRVGQCLYEPGHAPRFVTFPVTFTATVFAVRHTAQLAQVAIVGREGLLGEGAFIPLGPLSIGAVVQSAGEGVRVDGAVIREEFKRGGPVRTLLLRYMQALLGQVAHTVVCMRYHRLEQQFCRWLLLTLDRSGGDELAVTHELVAELLGVRRESVTEVIRGLTEGNILATRRRHIHVTDRAGLERRACECYADIHSGYRQLALPVDCCGAASPAPGSALG